ncbi:DUF3817 domain-containing protein, partial [Myroides sp. LoEW2-1]
VLKSDQKWSMKTYALICIASIIPFGTFVMEKRVLSNA